MTDVVCRTIKRGAQMTFETLSCAPMANSIGRLGGI